MILGLSIFTYVLYDTFLKSDYKGCFYCSKFSRIYGCVYGFNTTDRRNACNCFSINYNMILTQRKK